MNLSTHPLQRLLPTSSRLVLGCMGLGGDWNHDPSSETDVARAHAAIEAALDIGITLFDHADIYTLGKAESVFGTLLRRTPSLRERVLLQTKCGIRFKGFQHDAGPKRYDLSAAYIEAQAEHSLARLGTDHLDLLLLHRPDALMETEEIAEAFTRLRRSGKVRHFGVSNMQAGQMAWLSRALDAPLAVNQLEMSLARLEPFEAGTCFNDPQAGVRPGALAWAGVMEYCQQEGVQLQAWGSLAKGRYTAEQARLPADEPVRTLIAELAHAHGLSREAVMLAWLMRHPARIQPVIGSSDPARIRACGDAMKLVMSREDWYALYQAARGAELP
ncbi:MAG: aldo/keto reductase [Paucibacter sp.]|nr:aldo/keto reductase [Roseateles sp.]